MPFEETQPPVIPLELFSYSFVGIVGVPEKVFTSDKNVGLFAPYLSEGTSLHRTSCQRMI